MSKNYKRISGIICFILLGISGAVIGDELPTESSVDKSLLPVTCQVQIFPETIRCGDTISILVTQCNSGDRPIEVSQLHSTVFCDNMITLRIRNTNRNEEFGMYEEETLREIGHQRPQHYRLQPGEKTIVFATSYTVPPLEEWSSDFWKHLREDITKSDQACAEAELDIRLKFQVASLPRDYSRSRESHEKHRIFHLRISSRSPDEMERIEQWYTTTPAEFFPELKYDREDPFVGIAGYRWPKKVFRPETRDHQLRIHKETFSPWSFVHTGNRYPSDPNNPETWQGWKELEESIEPSTMRDEIRMTRMLIQYCDTEDPAVLEELTSWLKEMNEIQRTVMIRNVQKLCGNFGSNSEILPAFDRFVETMQPFETSK